jgi:hypothetical protein
MAEQSMDELRRNLAVITSRVDRHDNDISQITLELRDLRLTVNSNHAAIMSRLEAMKDTWMGTLTEHGRQDLACDMAIKAEINEQAKQIASIKTWLIGLGVGLGVFVPAVKLMIEFGILSITR